MTDALHTYLSRKDDVKLPLQPEPQPEPQSEGKVGDANTPGDIVDNSMDEYAQNIDPSFAYQKREEIARFAEEVAAREKAYRDHIDQSALTEDFVTNPDLPLLFDDMVFKLSDIKGWQQVQVTTPSGDTTDLIRLYCDGFEMQTTNIKLHKFLLDVIKPTPARMSDDYVHAKMKLNKMKEGKND